MKESRDSVARGSNGLHERAVHHFLHRVRTSSLATEPFPHLVCEQAFPAPYYRQLLDSLPPTSAYTPARRWKKFRKRSKRACGVEGSRYDIYLRATSENRERDVDASCGPGRATDFLNGLSDCLASAATVRALIQEATPFTDQVARFGAEAEVRLVREEGAVLIEPHVDKAFKYMTVLFYLGEPESLEPWRPGTTLYELRPDPFAGGRVLRLPRPVTDGLEAVFEVPFESNTALIMPRYENSVHGVGAAAFEGSRDTLHLYIQAQRRDGYSRSGYVMPADEQSD